MKNKLSFLGELFGWLLVMALAWVYTHFMFSV